jgi:hypothetical protein
MSDTDKDKPYWVTARWWEPEHRHCQHDARTGRWWPPHRGARRVCDLPDRPVITRPGRVTWRGGYRRAGCHWEAVNDRHPFSSPPRWFRDHRWANPQRVAVRDLGRRAAAEYRAGRVVEVELPVNQHRHSARWDWE